jgi:hypothetical protein
MHNRTTSRSLLVASAVLAILLILVLVNFLFHTKPIQVQKKVNTIPSKTADLLNKEWKTFISTTDYKYQIDYPADWNVVSGSTYDYVRFENPGVKQYIQVTCPRGVGKYKTELPNSKEWEPNEGGATTKYQIRKQINGMQAIQYIWGEERPESDILYTSLLRNTKPLVCEIWTPVNFTSSDYPTEIKQLAIYDRMIDSFKFIN